jgi:hypothetical protein
MVAGLKAFALYVPRKLVLALIARGDLGALPADIEIRSLGVHQLRGIAGATEIFTLSA